MATVTAIIRKRTTDGVLLGPERDVPEGEEEEDDAHPRKVLCQVHSMSCEIW